MISTFSPPKSLPSTTLACQALELGLPQTCRACMHVAGTSQQLHPSHVTSYLSQKFSTTRLTTYVVFDVAIATYRSPKGPSGTESQHSFAQRMLLTLALLTNLTHAAYGTHVQAHGAHKHATPAHKILHSLHVPHPRPCLRSRGKFLCPVCSATIPKTAMARVASLSCRWLQVTAPVRHGSETTDFFSGEDVLFVE